MASRRAFSSCNHNNSDVIQALQRIESRQKASHILQFVIYISSIWTCVMVAIIKNKKHG
jgi:hypothetical protein